jgi:hypothetical protein
MAAIGRGAAMVVVMAVTGKGTSQPAATVAVVRMTAITGVAAAIAIAVTDT